MILSSLCLCDSVANASSVDFQKQIAPIFAEHCYKCHGYKKRESGLRLDRKASVFAGAESGQTLVVPGKSADSRLWKVVAHEDELAMPAKGDPLTEPQVELIRQWIDQGTPWPDGIDPEDPKPSHWAFIPPRKAELPKVKDAAWAAHPIDRFIGARLESESLPHNPEADRRTLARRMWLDLTGLPPTPQIVDQFADDPAPGAYEKLVDRALADPAYGERMARIWLDLARYADSAGYGSDPLRPDLWPWRDWVIRAFNANMTFDQFTLEQMAGDLLPGAMPRQILATAFHRNTMTNTEGGTDDEEFRVAAVKDRVNTTVQAWMGLTMGCAQCHTHKYDPITQREYYSFFAIFNQTADSDKPDEQPRLAMPTEDESRRMRELQARIDGLQKQLDDLKSAPDSPQISAEMATWESAYRSEPVWHTIKPAAIVAPTFTFHIDEDGSVLVTGGTANKTTYTIQIPTKLQNITAFQLELLIDPSLPKSGPGRDPNGNAVVNEITVALMPATPKGKPKNLPIIRASADYSEKNRTASSAIDGDTATGWGVGGKTGQSHRLVLELEKPLDNPSAKAELSFNINQTTGADLTIGSFRIQATIQNPPAHEIPGEIRKIIAVAPIDRTADQSQKLREYFIALSGDYTRITADLRAAQRQLQAIKPVAVPILKELPASERRVSHLLVKGNFLNPGSEAKPSLPEAFHFNGVVKSGEPVTRLTVARWLTDRANPLTARVQVNRFWAALFGKGLVETEEDFGTQGLKPTHPELLDWLAVHFMESGWDIKAMLKLIVTSQTYRQSAAVTADQLSRDPENRLHSRGPRFRLDAEFLRDQALSLSGLLSRKMYGPSVYPPQPEGLWRAAFNGQRTYPTSTGQDAHRRGLYTFLRRTVPYPSMSTFDAPSRETCTLRRVRTNTPLQAFVTLNDPVFVECAQALARRLIAEGGRTPEDRVRFGLKLVTAHPPAAEQIAALTRLYTDELARYAADEKSAKLLATDPLGPLPAEMKLPEAAAWTVVANVLLNLDGVLMK